MVEETQPAGLGAKFAVPRAKAVFFEANSVNCFVVALRVD